MHTRTRSPRPRTHLRRTLGAALAVSVGACAGNSPTLPDPFEGHTNTVVLAWNEIATDAFVEHDGYSDPLEAVRVIGMLHLAQHDALSAISPAYEPYALQASDEDADPVVAAAAAAHGVLVAMFPDQAPGLDERLAEFLGALDEEDARDRSLSLGQAAAEAILQNRAGDGSDTPMVGDYEPGTGPGRYQFVPPFDFVVRPGWQTLRPFGLSSPDQFRSPPPPALESTRYAQDFEEVKAYGRADSSARSPDQTAYAAFWHEFSDLGWNRVARTVAADRELDLQSTARLFGLLNMALSDAYVAGWDSKFRYDFWRPYTAIRAAATDGNPATEPDPEWESAEVNPPVQDYPSTHSALGNAAAEVLASVFGDETGFTFPSTTAVPANGTRTFTGFREAADENADSRVMAGLHFRFACDTGQELGRRVGEWTVANHLLPR